MPILIPDLVHAAQLHLPKLNHVSGLVIMDALRNTASLVRTKNTGHWAGWIIYLIEALQEHADPDSFKNVLLDLRQDINTALSKDDEAQPADQPTRRGHHVYAP